MLSLLGKEATEQECEQKQKDLGFHYEVTIDGYADFIFIIVSVRYSTKPPLNKAIEELSVIAMMSKFLHSDEPDVLLPHFSCHCLDIHLQQEL